MDVQENGSGLITITRPDPVMPFDDEPRTAAKVG